MEIVTQEFTLFYTFTLIIFRKSIILQSTDSLLFKG
nr:MAG TPA: hypothetical protein [Caudoviricetes sp.]DAX71718.1 MAG TPA: hypothetical protein [Caudoviricetes sp.]